MSFLNPISMLVKQFSSTDANAPKLTHGKRTAGDIKTILKACLATGYGEKTGAGWVITNETDYTITLASEYLQAQQYELIIDDSSATQTLWNYRFQGVVYNTIKTLKNSANLDSATYGWQLLVSNAGLYFIEKANMVATGDIGASILYAGQLQSAVTSKNGKNMAVWCFGFQSAESGGGRLPDVLKNPTVANGVSVIIEDVNFSGYTHPMLPVLQTYDSSNGIVPNSYIKIWASLGYIGNNNFIAQQPGMLVAAKNNTLEIFNALNQWQDRPVVMLNVARNSSTSNNIKHSSTAEIIIFTDNWVY